MARSDQRILFVANAGPRAGGGHVMRCLTLAGALKDLGAVCGFVASPEVARVLAAFAGPEIERLDGRGEDPATLCEDALAAIGDWKPHLVVCDHYGLGARQEGVLRAAAGRLLAIDDLMRAHDADLVLDSNLGRTAADYPGLTALTGADYTLIRPAFRDLREIALVRRSAETGVGRILVAMGLTDLDGITARVLAALQPHLGPRQVDVVLGSGAAGLQTVLDLARGDRRIEVHVDTRAMSALTAAADLAIGAGGSSTWERCCLGLPTLTVILADNQRPNARALEAAGATVTLEAGAPDFESQLGDRVAGLFVDETHLKRLSAASAALVDGLGAERVAKRVRGWKA